MKRHETLKLNELPEGLKEVFSKQANEHWHKGGLVFTKHIDGRVWLHYSPEGRHESFVGDDKGFRFYIIWTKLNQLFYE